MLKMRKLIEKMKKFGRDEEGLSVAEFLLVLGATGFLLYIVIGKFYPAYKNAQNDGVVDQIRALSQNVKNIYNGQASYGTGSLNATVNSMKGWPTDMVQGGSYVHALGGSVTITGATTQYTIAAAGLDSDECAYVATHMTNGTGGALVSVQANSTALTLPATLSTAVTACSAAAGANTVTWTFQ